MPKERIPVVEAMRGIAAIGVALYHFSGRFDTGLPLVFHSYGWLGVDIFFVISGFVIPLSLYGKDYQLRDFPMFIMRRLVRLEPPYLASIGLGLILWHASSVAPGFRGTDPSYSLPQVLGHLFYAIPLTSYASEPGLLVARLRICILHPGGTYLRLPGQEGDRIHYLDRRDHRYCILRRRRLSTVGT
jgi:peptidoglycan/LPS O-acetylase OafA/YrhL